METLQTVALNVEVIKVTLLALVLVVPLLFIGLALLGSIKARMVKPLRPADRRARRPSLEWEIGAARTRETFLHPERV